MSPLSQYEILLNEKIKTSQFDKTWSKSIAVGNQDFVKNIFKNLELNSERRNIKYLKNGMTIIKDPEASYDIHIEAKNMLLVSELCEN